MVLGSDSGDAFSLRNPRRLDRDGKGGDWEWRRGCGQGNPGGGLEGELTKTELSQEEKPEEATVCAYGTEGAH